MSQAAGVHPIERSITQGQLGIQIPIGVEPGYEANPILREYLEAAQEHGLSVVEMNVVDHDGVKAAALSDFVSAFGLRIQNLATGGMAVKRDHSLAHPDADTRADAVATIRQTIHFSRSIADHTGLTPPGIILGLVQGKSNDSKAGQRNLFAHSLEELLPSAEAAGFRGPYAIEGNLNTTVRDAIAKSVATLNA